MPREATDSFSRRPADWKLGFIEHVVGDEPLERTLSRLRSHAFQAFVLPLVDAIRINLLAIHCRNCRRPFFAHLPETTRKDHVRLLSGWPPAPISSSAIFREVVFLLLPACSSFPSAGLAHQCRGGFPHSPGATCSHRSSQALER